MEASPRLEGHTLTELWTVTAKCECGWETKIAEVEAMGRKTASLKDELMDRHAHHIARAQRRLDGTQEPS